MIKKDNTYDFAGICNKFSAEGAFLSAVLYGEGKINNTFLVTTALKNGRTKKYILQRINTKIFSDVKLLMQKFSVLLKHFKSQKKAPLKTLKLLQTKNKKIYLKYGNEYFRMMEYIDGECFSSIQKEEQLFEFGRAVGSFQKMLKGIAPDESFKIKQDLHNTPKHFVNFEKSIQINHNNRADECENDIAFIYRHRDMTDLFQSKIESGILPKRIVHGDTKLSNMIFDEAKIKVVGIIDYDSITSGSALHDFGDAVRSSCKIIKNDGTVTFNMERYNNFTKGYLSVANEFLTREEKRLLCVAPLQITYELGMRYLTDYLNGDIYFKIKEKGDNLKNARINFLLFEDIKAQLGR